MADRYLIYEQLGAGGVGAVFRAYDNQLRRWVAIKRLTIGGEAAENGTDIQEQLRQEADSLASLRNPNIVTIFDVASDDEGLFIVMELLEGEDLASVVARGPLPYDDFKELARQTLEGLLAAHERHILHRDIKPENIKVERLPGGRLQSKIIDFGLARVGLKARKQTEDVSGSVMGSIHYMAPEQLSREPVDERTDLYSLGCVFYEALSGHKAFDGASMGDVIDKHLNHEIAPLHTIAPHVPAWLGAWVERLMAPRPDDRPASAQQAIDEFRAWEKMPTMVPYMPWMAAPEAYYTPQQEAIPVAVVDEPAHAAPPRRTAGVGASSGRLPTRTGAHSAPAKKKGSKAPLIIGLVAVLVGAGFFFLRGGKKDEAAPGAPSSSGKAAAPAQPAFDLPVGRLMPPLDDDRVLHFVADTGTFQAGQSSDGKPFPAYVNDSVMRWHDVAPRGQDNFLTPLEGKANLAPKRVVWPTAPSGPSVKGNRAALQFKAFSGPPPILEGRFAKASASFPFGNDAAKGPRGATIAVVFQTDPEVGPVTVLTLQGKSTDSLRLETTAAKNLLATASSSGGQARLESQGIDATAPTIAIVIWDSVTDKLHLMAINPVSEPKGKLPLFQKSAEGTAPAPAGPLDYLLVGGSSAGFQGLLAELLVYACALNEEQRRILGSTQLKSYYFK